MRIPAAPLVRFALAAAALASIGGQALGAAFTSRAAFEAALPAGKFFNDFATVPDAIDAPVASVSASGGVPATAYTISAPGGVGVFPDAPPSKAIGNWQPGDDLTISFTSGNVYAAGGEVWLSDIAGTRLAGSITVNFSDGTSAVVPSNTSGAFGYIGVLTSGAPLTSVTIVASSPAFLNLSRFTTAVPEPAAAGLALCAALAQLGRRRVR